MEQEPKRSNVRNGDTLARIVRQRQAAGEVVVFTNGCFDLLHLGHVRYLEEARALGDLLVVGLNSDASVRRIKGPKRPLVSEDERAAVLGALRCVDYVLVFEEDTASATIEVLKPAIYVKGGDYALPGATTPGASLPEAAIVQGYGGKVKLLPYLAGYSTSELIATIVQRYKNEKERRFHQ